MERSKRWIIASAVVIAGAVVALFTGGGQVGPCLGPIGVTPVQCAQATGVFPDMGIGLPVLLASGALALVVVAPPRRSRRVRTLAATVVGGAIGAGAFLAMAPRTMEGLTSNGSFLSIPRPLDGNAFVSMILLAALTGFVLAAYIGRRQRGFGRGTSPSSGPAGR